MAVPVRKTSKQRKRSRCGHTKLAVSVMHHNATTGEHRLGHRVSPNGYYKGCQAIKKASDND